MFNFLFGAYRGHYFRVEHGSLSNFPLLQSSEGHFSYYAMKQEPEHLCPDGQPAVGRAFIRWRTEAVPLGGFFIEAPNYSGQGLTFANKPRITNINSLVNQHVCHHQVALKRVNIGRRPGSTRWHSKPPCLVSSSRTVKLQSSGLIPSQSALASSVLTDGFHVLLLRVCISPF